jgi:hypothetical protein
MIEKFGEKNPSCFWDFIRVKLVGCGSTAPLGGINNVHIIGVVEPHPTTEQKFY